MIIDDELGWIARKDTMENKEDQKAILLDALEHVQETEKLAAQIVEKSTSFDELTYIGQRFNGLIGSFGFYKDITEFGQILKLAEMIDTIATHYKNNEENYLWQNHLDFVIASVTLSIKILKASIERLELETKVNEDFQSIESSFQDLWEIEEKTNLNQGDIDKMVD